MHTRTEDKIVNNAIRLKYQRQELEAALLRYNKTRADMGKAPLVLGTKRNPVKEIKDQRLSQLELEAELSLAEHRNKLLKMKRETNNDE